MTKLTLQDHEITGQGDLAAGHIKADTVQRSEPKKVWHWKQIETQEVFVCLLCLSEIILDTEGLGFICLDLS